MNLHNNKELFNDYLLATTDFFGFSDVGIIEKDYFIVYFLKKIIEKQPNIVFAGGTSLSKCYKLIKRFSEDIDLNLNTEAARVTEGQRKQLKRDIVSIIEDSGFSLENADQIRSRRDSNRYVIDYKSLNSFDYLKQYLVVETSVFIKSFPSEIKDISCLIYDFMLEKNLENEVIKYDLKPYSLRVQSLVRTFIDKVFALADYYLNGQIKNHSRHIYDIHCIYPKITFNTEFTALVEKVRDVRKKNAIYLSAKDDIDLPEILRKIIIEKIYESDYNQVTRILLFEDVSYENAIETIQNLIDDGYFKV